MITCYTRIPNKISELENSKNVKSGHKYQFSLAGGRLVLQRLRHDITWPGLGAWSRGSLECVQQQNDHWRKDDDDEARLLPYSRE